MIHGLIEWFVCYFEHEQILLNSWSFFVTLTFSDCRRLDLFSRFIIQHWPSASAFKRYCSRDTAYIQYITLKKVCLTDRNIGYLYLSVKQQTFFRVICMYYPEEGLFDRPKYWLSLFISLYIFGFLFVVWRWFFFTSLLSTSTPVSRLRFIDVDPAAVLVPVAFFFYILYSLYFQAAER